MDTPTGTCTVPLNISFMNTDYWIMGWFYKNTSEGGGAYTRYGATQPYTVASFQIGTYTGKENKIRYIAIGI